MSDELLPVGQVCNLSCTYCYENPMREAGNIGKSYNLNAIFKTLEKRDQSFSLFGGEPLLMKFDDLTKVLEFGYNRYGHTGIQTNGTLITEKHVDLFKRYKTHIGISIDGPGELNAPRCDERLTKKTLDNLVLLLANHIELGLIITLHRANCSSEKFDSFCYWLHWLDSLFISNVRLHLLEAHHDPSIKLENSELLEILIKLHKLETTFKNLKFDKFREMQALLEDPNTNATCIFKECDVYDTAAVQGVSGQGTMHNCGRTNKDGVDWTKSDRRSNIRQITL